MSLPASLPPILLPSVAFTPPIFALAPATFAARHPELFVFDSSVLIAYPAEKREK